MIKKSSEGTTLSNLFADGISILGVIFSTLLSFLITAACALSDYTQIFSLLDAVQHESAATVIIGSVTIVIFLDFSMYVAGTAIKRMAFGKPLGGSTAISVVSVVLSFLLFGAVFALTFKFKYALRDYLFSLDSAGAVDTVINKAVKVGSEVIGNIANVNIGEETIISISAILAGLMPAFTSVLSLLSVFLLYDPILSETAAVKIKLMLYKYRYYKTQKQLTAVESEVFQYEQLPQLYHELLESDYNNYTQLCKEIIASEQVTKIAEFTAAIELFKNDQDTVTRLSSEASNIKDTCRMKSSFEETNDVKLPDELLKQIDTAGKLFDNRKSFTNESWSDMAALSEEPENTRSFEIPGTQKFPVSPFISSQNDESDEVPYDYDDPDSVTADVHLYNDINIPDSMVSPQLNQAVNQ